MAKTFLGPIARPRPAGAGLAWLADIAGAALFAGCLAVYIGELAAGKGGLHQILLVSGMVAGGIVRAGAQQFAAIAGQRDAGAAKARLRAHVFARLLPTGARRGALAGEDLRVAVDNVEASEGYIARFQPLRLAASAGPFLVAALVAPASWVSAVIMLATLVPFIAGMALAGMAARTEADRQFDALSRLSGLFVDRVRHLPIILAYNVEDRIARQLGAAAQDVAERTMRVLRIAFLSSAVLEFFAALSVALVAVYCGFALLGLLPFTPPEELDLTRAFFALAMAPEFYIGMRRLAAAYHDKQQGEAAANSLAATCEAADAALAPPGPPLTNIYLLAAEGLVAGYPGGWRLAPLNHAWAGPGLHAITGETGSGKSSLLQALVGGVALIDGRLLAGGEQVEPGALASSIGWAGQNVLLLPGTLRSNLLLGNPGASDQQVSEALVALGLDELVRMRGLDMPIDPRGSGLSGGERRRVGLARAALSARPILLLDEPTADLDDANRGKVIAAIGSLAQTRLVIAATHDAELAATAASEVAL